VTVSVPDPPSAEKDRVLGDTVMSATGDGLSCHTDTVVEFEVSEKVTVPVLSELVTFVDTSTVQVVSEPVTVIQESDGWAETVPVALEMVTVCGSSPPSSNVSDDGDAEMCCEDDPACLMTVCPRYTLLVEVDGVEV